MRQCAISATLRGAACSDFACVTDSPLVWQKSLSELPTGAKNCGGMVRKQARIECPSVNLAGYSDSLVIQYRSQHPHDLDKFMLGAGHCADVLVRGGCLIAQLFRLTVVVPDPSHLSLQLACGY